MIGKPIMKYGRVCLKTSDTGRLRNRTPARRKSNQMIIPTEIARARTCVPSMRAALAPYTRNAAVVIVAQRVSTISTADNILVLEDGQVVGSGTHAELIESNPTYAEIVQSQIGEEKAA